MVIASILLSNRAAYLAATFAVLLFGGTAAAERLALLPHHHLAGVHSAELYFDSPAYLPAVFSAFAATLYIVVYMSTSIVNRLRMREAELVGKDRVKSQYVQTLSHDIRGSLAAIQSCLTVVVEGMTGPIPERSGEMVARAERRSRALLHYIDELLYLSTLRVEGLSGREPVDLLDTIDNVAARFRPVLESRGLELTVVAGPAEAFVFGDPDSLERLLTALVDNAVRYAADGGSLAIRVAEPPRAGQIEVSVIDDGPGIRFADLPHVFEDFYTGSAAEAVEPQGPGLGLAIAREIVHAHGGRIRLESAEGRGSTFTFTVPSHPAPGRHSRGIGRPQGDAAD